MSWTIGQPSSLKGACRRPEPGAWGFAPSQRSLAPSIMDGLSAVTPFEKKIEPNPPTLGSTKEVDAWLTVSGKVGTDAEGVPKLAYKALK